MFHPLSFLFATHAHTLTHTMTKKYCTISPQPTHTQCYINMQQSLWCITSSQMDRLVVRVVCEKVRPDVTQKSFERTDYQTPEENGDTKSRDLSITSLQSMPHISLVQRKSEGGCRSNALKGRLVRGGHSCSCQRTEGNSSGGGEGHCEERQPPLVCDVSTAAKNSPRESHRGAGRGELQGGETRPNG